MPKKTFTPEQIVGKLRQIEVCHSRLQLSEQFGWPRAVRLKVGQPSAASGLTGSAESRGSHRSRPRKLQ